MSIDRYMGMPNTTLHIIQACTMHPTKVEDVEAPDGDGKVKCKCPALFGKKASTNWIPCANSNIGNDEKSRKQTGLHNPAKPGTYGYIFFPGGNMDKPVFMASHATMNEKATE
jgi:hypothetical protein